MQKIITIVGGKGQMGKLFTHYWQQQFIVRSLDQNDWPNAQGLLKDCDLAVICIPIHDTTQIIAKIAKYLPPQAVMADFTSIKISPLTTMLSVHTGPVLGLHPMFGPTIASPYQQVIINCGGRPDYQWILDSLNDIGFTITSMDATAHDEAMSFIQGIEHFSTFALGTFLHKHQQHPNDLFNLASPIYQAKLALLGRIFDQDAALYADIVSASNERLDLIGEYAKYLTNWVTRLKQGEKADFIHEFNQTKEWMGDFTHKAQLASDHFLTVVSKSFPPNNE